MLIIGALSGIGLIAIGWLCCDQLRTETFRQLRAERDSYREGRQALVRAERHLAAAQAEAQGTINVYKRLAALHHAQAAGMPVEEWWARQQQAVGEV